MHILPLASVKKHPINCTYPLDEGKEQLELLSHARQHQHDVESHPSPEYMYLTRHQIHSNALVLLIAAQPASKMQELKTLPEYLKASNADGTAILEATTTWCSQCKAIAPFVEKLMKKYPEARFYNYDTDTALGMTQTQHFKADAVGDVLMCEEQTSRKNSRPTRCRRSIYSRMEI